ncbi:dTDP-glucose 4,6-dehydratase [Psittacicella hinzii]|uniref:NAD(P)-binding domain-containing protein n=1 Tax=Psittacicella hinzii TaxID=2028575 RepID=A0A3A1YD08_9GAMM|nr:GDP-mannose 4,6-dehydratase [Psittacicella hinzii]RIY35109.1 hypothetical protein CKF58_07090 [Psittacicella hinzii]
MQQNFLITGGAGFIGSHLVSHLLTTFYQNDVNIVVVDTLDYAANLSYIHKYFDDPRLSFYQLNIKDTSSMVEILKRHNITTVFHLAAKSHVDDSIYNPELLVSNNISATTSLAEAIRIYFLALSDFAKANFKLINISTDEVFGDQNNAICPVTENSVYNPSSPYSASKAASDLILNAYAKTYNINTLTLYLCNNYGPNQYPEKLVPLCILSMLDKEPIRLYGDGKQIRNWIYVKDCVQLITKIYQQWPSIYGNKVVINGQSLTNLEITNKISQALTELRNEERFKIFENLKEDFNEMIEFTADRPGHDIKYWSSDNLLQSSGIDLPVLDFDAHIKDTIVWYIQNFDTLIEKVRTFDHRKFNQSSDNLLSLRKGSRKRKNLTL